MSPKFEPSSLLDLGQGGHAMTIVGALLDDLRRSVARAPRRVPVIHRYFRVDEESTLLALVSDQPSPKEAPTLVLVHGLTGSADAGYMRSTAAKLYQRGFNVVRVNVRNCGGTERLTPTLYHTGLTEDLRALLAALHEDDGRAHISVAGFSMGGNMALKLLGEWGKEAPSYLRAAAAISPPINLAAASRALNQGLLNRVYQRSFLNNLKALIRRKASLYPDRYKTEALKKISTLREFDDQYIAPCFGFENADDYYARASAGPHLAQIARPTLVIHARDDSIIPVEDFEQLQASAALSVHITERGGHAGFIGKARGPDPDRFWAENRLVEFFNAQR